MRFKFKAKLWLFVSISLLTSITNLGASAYAGPRDQAYRIYNRLAGVPPSHEQLNQLEKLAKEGKFQDIALAAMDHHLFYTETLKKMFAPWSNEAMSTTFTRANGSSGVILNDYVATLIGMVRDDLPFNEVLSHDYLYVGEGSNVPADLPDYAINNNTHYDQLDRLGINLKEALVRRSQIELNPMLANHQSDVDESGKPVVPAGVMTSRAFSEAYYIGGTNRAAFRFILMTYFCEDVQTFHDTTIVTDRIRRDVERNALFVTKCQGCHAGMDGFTGALAYLDWDEEDKRMIYSKPAPGVTAADLQNADGDYRCSNTEVGNSPTAEQFEEFCVRPKYRSNLTQFPMGFKTVDDSWINYWNQGQNTKIGWPGDDNEMHRGSGPRSFGELMANTKQFSSCMAKRVFTQVCYRDPASKIDSENVSKLANSFVKKNYNMRGLFAEAVSLCPGE